MISIIVNQRFPDDISNLVFPEVFKAVEKLFPTEQTGPFPCSRSGKKGE